MRVHVERCNCGVPDPDSGETILEVDERGTVHPYKRDPRCREFTKLVVIYRVKKIEAALLDAAARLATWRKNNIGGTTATNVDDLIAELRLLAAGSIEKAIYQEDELYDCPEHGRQIYPWCKEPHEDPDLDSYDCPIHGLQDGPDCPRC